MTDDYVLRLYVLIMCLAHPMIRLKKKNISWSSEDPGHVRLYPSHVRITVKIDNFEQCICLGHVKYICIIFRLIVLNLDQNYT